MRLHIGASHVWPQTSASRSQILAGFEANTKRMQAF
jgi:hypothetical protein